MRILIVDDDRGIVGALRNILEFEGIEVAAVNDGLAGLEYLHVQPLPDLVLLDLFMPCLSGREFLERLADQARFRNLPVVIMTAASGGDLMPPPGSYLAILRKPFDLDELMEVVDRARR